MTLWSSSVEAATRVVSNLHIPAFPSFSLDETTAIATRLVKCKKGFENLLIALNVTNDSQKLALLLNYVGEECYDIYDNLLIPGTQESYSNVIRLLMDTLNLSQILAMRFIHLERLNRTLMKRLVSFL